MTWDEIHRAATERVEREARSMGPFTEPRDGWELSTGSAEFYCGRRVYGRWYKGFALFAFESAKSTSASPLFFCPVEGRPRIGRTLDEACELGERSVDSGDTNGPFPVTFERFRARMDDPRVFQARR